MYSVFTEHVEYKNIYIEAKFSLETNFWNYDFMLNLPLWICTKKAKVHSFLNSVLHNLQLTQFTNLLVLLLQSG